MGALASVIALSKASEEEASEDNKQEAQGPRLGILAFGSLIWAPESELDAIVSHRISNVKTPFKVEFARKSTSRGYGPTLIRVEEGGAEVNGMILVLKDDITAEQATEVVKKRERGAPVSRLRDFNGINVVLYADPQPNIENLSPRVLAELAINSVRLTDVGRDGITYLMKAKDIGIVTPLMQVYEKEVLWQTSTKTLVDALGKLIAKHSVRQEQ